MSNTPTTRQPKKIRCTRYTTAELRSIICHEWAAVGALVLLEYPNFFDLSDVRRVMKTAFSVHAQFADDVVTYCINGPSYILGNPERWFEIDAGGGTEDDEGQYIPHGYHQYRVLFERDAWTHLENDAFGNTTKAMRRLNDAQRAIWNQTYPNHAE